MRIPSGPLRSAERLKNTTAIQQASRSICDVPISQLKPNPNNPRKHSRAQIEAIATSMEVFGFNGAVLVGKNYEILAGHGRVMASQLLGRTHVRVIRLEHLTTAQARAFMLADNKLSDRSEWDPRALAVHLKELTSITLDFEIEATGFEIGEIDLLIQAADDAQDEGAGDAGDEIPEHEDSVVSRQGDLWILDNHRAFCGDSCDAKSYETLMAGKKASAIFADPPYNLAIGSVSGRGKTKHREFAMGSGEMTTLEFTNFLAEIFKLLIAHSDPGSVHFHCMDWRHQTEILTAGSSSYSELLNLCVWVKANAGMGSLYRSRHELVFVFKNGLSRHRNNVELGRFGRNRTNVWSYAGVKNFANKEENLARAHPTPKPVSLVADAILDVTKLHDIVLDPFLGSGTTIIAAERTGRHGYGIEIDPRYVDVTIRRWEHLTEKQARHESGQTFEEMRVERREGHGR